MPRWRPPQPGSSPYITPEGAARLRAELQHLWKGVRPEVVRALSAAAAEGDRSENAEYTYRKKQLGEIDRRVRYLSKRLERIKIVDRLPADQSVVRFGAWVKLAGDAGRRLLRIVGADETDARLNFISIDSPVARAMLGKRLGDSVAVTLPEGEQAFEIEEIHYHEPET